jgi:hypothetical protein
MSSALAIVAAATINADASAHDSAARSAPLFRTYRTTCRIGASIVLPSARGDDFATPAVAASAAQRRPA